MTESEWLACDDPRAMYDLVKCDIPPRLRHLFAHACGRRHCRHCWVLEFQQGSRLSGDAAFVPAMLPEAGELSARLIDLADEQCEGINHWRRIEELAGRVADLDPPGAFRRDLVAALDGDVGHWVWRDSACPESEDRHQAGLFRDILGNPFRRRAVAPSWLTPDAVALAHAAYLPDGRGALAPEVLGVLSDALEEAGCDDRDLLAHLRGPGEHVRGCWAVDLVLGKR